jgi:hypothetical protein
LDVNGHLHPAPALATPALSIAAGGPLGSFLATAKRSKRYEKKEKPCVTNRRPIYH